MGAAYYIELEKEINGLDTMMEGKAHQAEKKAARRTQRESFE